MRLTLTAHFTAVPTHFAKVLLCSRTPRSSSLALVKPSGGFGDGKEWVQGAFVLPNEPIPDETRLEGFVVPGASLTTVQRSKTATVCIQRNLFRQTCAD